MPALPGPLAHQRNPVIFHAILLVALLLAAGCTQRGDLGRYENAFGLPLNTAHNQASPEGHGAPAIIYTDSERQLRILGERLEAPVHVDPAWDNDRWNIAFRELGYVGVSTNDAASYQRRLRSPSRNSGPVIWNRIIADMVQDEKTVTRFIHTAEEVVSLDQRRLAALRRNRTGGPGAAADVRERTRLNAAYVGKIAAAARHRQRAYGTAIDRMAYEAPDSRERAAHIARNELADAVEMLGNMAERANALASGDHSYGRRRNAGPGRRAPIVDLSLRQ